MLIPETLSHPQPEAVTTATDQPQEQLNAISPPLERLRQFGEGIAVTATFAVATIIALSAYEATLLAKDEKPPKGKKSKLSLTEREGLQGNIQRRLDDGEISIEQARQEQQQIADQQREGDDPS